MGPINKSSGPHLLSSNHIPDDVHYDAQKSKVHPDSENVPAEVTADQVEQNY